MTNIDAYDILEEGGEYMIQILICDDNPLHSEEIQVMIQKLIPKDITVNYIKTKSKEESLNYIRKGQEHSWIIFMDILLSDKENGIETLPSNRMLFKRLYRRHKLSLLQVIWNGAQKQDEQIQFTF